ncbi:hypothetical protein DITRI_Ditri13aG0004600 [Diplodiscus trichospermus]
MKRKGGSKQCVFCGSRAGYKTSFSDAAFELVIPKALLPHEISGETVGELKTVSDMHQRKSRMAKHADAFIALPGGYGTMEELLEMITWSQLGIHEKPGVEEGFIDTSARQIVVIADTAEELIRKMEEYAPAHDKVAAKQSWEVDQ